VPIFVPSRRERPAPIPVQWPRVPPVSDVGTAMTEARQAAGEKNKPARSRTRGPVYRQAPGYILAA